MMQIGYMSQGRQIMIREAVLFNGNYSIRWLASVYHQDILVCIKSSWMTYDELKRCLMDHCNEMVYQDQHVYWKLASKKTFIQIPLAAIKPPVDIILLPVKKNEILIPRDEKEYEKYQKTVKGLIRCLKQRESSVFSLHAIEHLIFLNDVLPLKKEEIAAEYEVDHLRYPITAEMIGQKINIQVPKKAASQLFITKDLSTKYNLTVSEA